MKDRKINIEDKLQALKHSEKYRREYEEYSKTEYQRQYKEYLKGRPLHEIADVHIFGLDPNRTSEVYLSPAGKEFCRRWKIAYPINPDTPDIKTLKENNWRSKWHYENHEAMMAWNPISFLTLPDDIEGPRRELSLNNRTGKILTHVNDKLVIKIDLSWSKGQLKKTFAEFIEKWPKNIQEQERIKIFKLDIWKVYKISRGFTKIIYWKTTKALFPEIKSRTTTEAKQTKYIANNQEMAEFALYEEVKRAHKEASDIIKAIEPKD